MDKQKKDPNYRGLFVIGLGLIGVGLSLSVTNIFAAGISILSVGIVFIIVGVSNRKKWVDPYAFSNTDSRKMDEEKSE